MSALPKVEETELEQATDPAILACGGDLRATIQSLIVANQYLEERNRQPDHEFEDSLKAEL